jgi:hypothetical protein
MARRLYSKSELAIELEKDRQTIGNALQNVKPDGEKGAFPAYYMMTAVRALFVKGGKSEALDANYERARKDKEMADKIEMANMVARGALIREDVVKKFIIDAFTRLRTRMLGLPTKLAIRLVGLKSAIEIQKILDDGIREALAELSEHSVLESAEAESAERAREAGGLLEGSEATS